MSPNYPLFFQSDDGLWLQPIPIYLSWIFGTFASVVVGAVDVVLIYFAAARLLKSQWAGVVAAIVLLLFPAHAAFSHQSVDAIYPVPFVIAWLICLLTFFDRHRPSLLFAGGLCLGVGVYTQPSAPLTMAALVFLTIGALWIEGHRTPAVFAAVVAGFGVPLLLMVPWFAAHPETYPDTMGAWAIHKAHIRSPLDGVRAFLNWNTLGTRASLYWEMLNPSFLFLAGGTMSASGLPGPPFLSSVAVLAPLGIARALTSMRPSIALVLVGGLLVTPLAASTFGQRHPIDAALPLVVFATLLSGLGAAQLLESQVKWIRFAGVALLALIPVQFFLF